MTKEREVLQQALKALEWGNQITLDEYGGTDLEFDNAIASIRDVLAQPEQDAVLSEREACANVCYEMSEELHTEDASLELCAAAIRARGETK